MKITMLALILGSALLLYSDTAIAGKKRCKALLTKLQNIQAQQRNGYSVKKGISLQNKADNVRDKWWRCENSSKYSQSGDKKASTNKKSKAKANAKPIKKESSAKIKASSPIKPFLSSKAVVINSRFQGKKQQAWLEYYQKPEKCRRIKSTQMFAFCVEDKTKQQDQFEQQYRY
jgi:hypothetical protein